MPMTPEIFAQKKAKAEAERAAMMRAFFAKREVKLLMSLVPATEPPETLQSLMELAFEAGADYGAASIGNMFLETMLKHVPKDGD